MQNQTQIPDSGTNQNFLVTVIFSIVGVVTLIALFAMLSGCKSLKQVSNAAIAKMDKADTKAKRKGVDTAGVNFCYTRYPMKIGTGTVKYLPSKPIIKTDTLTITELVKGATDTLKITKKVYINTFTHDTLVRTDTFNNDGKVRAQQAEISGLIADRDKYKGMYENERKGHIKTAKTRLYGWCAFSLLLLAIAVYIGYRVRKG